MSEPFEKSIEKWTDAELIEALRKSLPEMIPYGEMVCADSLYGQRGPMVWPDPEFYFMAEAANRLERNNPQTIVRCKDCYWLYAGPDYYCCRKHTGLVTITADSFCSYGRSRKNEDEEA